jgi:hypothetical protein
MECNPSCNMLLHWLKLVSYFVNRITPNMTITLTVAISLTQTTTLLCFRKQYHLEYNITSTFTQETNMYSNTLTVTIPLSLTISVTLSTTLLQYWKHPHRYNIILLWLYLVRPSIYGITLSLMIMPTPTRNPLWQSPYCAHRPNYYNKSTLTQKATCPVYWLLQIL